MEDELYKDIEYLIQVLEKIKLNGSGDISIPKALYILALEIKKLKDETNDNLQS